MRVEFRIRADAIAGYKGVPLFWPMSGNWPTDGEIDFPESNFMDQPKAFMHHQDAALGADQDWYQTPTGTSWQTWHDYVIEWIPGIRCEFFLDGVSIGRSASRVPNSPMHLAMQFETGLSGGAPSDGLGPHSDRQTVGVDACDSVIANVDSFSDARRQLTPGAMPAAGGTPLPTVSPSPGASATAGSTPVPEVAPMTTPTTGSSFGASQDRLAVRYSDSSAQITYSAGWAIAKSRMYLGGAVHFARSRNARATIRFTGSAVTG